MAKIGLKQLVHDIKEAYVSASGDTEPVTYGNIADKIANIRSGGGVIGGHTVTFKADGKDYAIISITDGQSVSAPIPNPTSESGTFNAWYNGDTKVDFPITPSESVELNAQFLIVRDNIILSKNGVWYAIRTKGNCIKTKDGWSIVGYPSSNGGTTDFYIVGETADSVANNFGRPATAFTYNGETYYYAIDNGYGNDYISSRGICEQFPSKNSNVENARSLLDHYFMKN